MRIPYAKAPVAPGEDPLERVLRARRLPFEVYGVTLYVRPPTLRESWQADCKERFSREAVRTQADAANLRSQPPSAMFAGMVEAQVSELRRNKKQTKEIKTEIAGLEAFGLLDEMAAEYAGNERDLYICWRCVVDENGKPVFDQTYEDALDKHPSAEAAAPVSLTVNSPRQAAALAIVQSAAERNLPLRVIGDTAVRLRCPTAERFPPTEDDEIVELVARSRQAPDLERVLAQRGITADARFNVLHASERLRFVDAAARLPIEVFLNAFEEYHRLDLAERLAADDVTLPLADVLLLQLQRVEFTPQDQKRILALLADHDLGPGKDAIDPARIVEVCADDWGWTKTVTMNLEKAIAAAPANLSAEAAGSVEARARRLMQLIDEAPKSLGWNVRARLGERRPWYNVPE